MSSVPTTPPASSATYTTRFYTPASTWSSSSYTPSTMASEGPSNVPGTAIALSGSRSTPAASSVSSAATAVSSSAAAGAAALKEASSGNNGGHALALALGLGLGLGLLLLLAILGVMYIARQRRLQRLAFAQRAGRIQQTMRSVDERPAGLETSQSAGPTAPSAAHHV